MKISDLLNDIRIRDLVLPEFQREYVWNKDQARQLLVSLVKEYPVGNLLFWKTDRPPELKNVDELPERLGAIQVILDGQQRLTTLFLLLEADIPPFYTERDLQNDPRDLYCNLADGTFQYYLKSLMQGDPCWRRVMDCFNPNVEINVFAIAQEVAADGEQEAFKLAEQYNRNLTKLRNIKEKDLPVQLVPSSATITEAIDIFDRVNSQGTKLTDAELALTHVTGEWPEARRRLKEKMAELARRSFYFDLTFMIRALTVIVTRRALYEIVHDRPKKELMEGWGRLSKLLDYVVSILPAQAFIHSTVDLATPNVLVPLLLYLDLRGWSFPNEKARRHAFHWLYAAQMWARYSGQTDQRLEHDVSIVVGEESPWASLCDQIIDQRGRVEVKAADLEGRWITHPLYRMTTIVAKAHGAVDWFNGTPLGTALGESYNLHSHHIFPRSLLYKNGYDADNHLHRKIVNEIANRAFLTAETNLRLGDVPPEKYLPEVEERYPGALVKQFVPINPELWKVEHFSEFLAARRELIAGKINEFMACLVAEPEVRAKRSVEEVRHLGESATLEFKSTLRWDLVRGNVNKELQFSVLKTIAAFLNTEGGTLLIGVDDDGGAHGLEQDFKTLANPTADAFQQTLVNLIVSHIGAEFAPFIKVRFEVVEEKDICVVEVDTAGGPVYLGTPRGNEFYIRVGNTSRSLDPQEAVTYVETHWQ